MYVLASCYGEYLFANRNIQFEHIPNISKLPAIQRKAKMLARLNKYLSSFEEVLEFAASMLALQNQEAQITSSFSGGNLGNNQNLSQVSKILQLVEEHELRRTQTKLRHQLRLCQSFIQPFENLMQMVLNA